MEDTVVAGWKDFFVMSGGAAAALGGLFVVAMSVNIKEILTERSLTSRAAATIAGLMMIVIVAAIGLIPGQTAFWVGGEILLGAIVLWVFTIVAVRRILEPNPHAGPPAQKVLRLLVQVLPAIPFTLGAILLMVDAPGGIGWVGGGVIAVFATSMVNAWVLLVEVLR